jgi:hypothetical protein
VRISSLLTTWQRSKDSLPREEAWVYPRRPPKRLALAFYWPQLRVDRISFTLGEAFETHWQKRRMIPNESSNAIDSNLHVMDAWKGIRGNQG